MKININDVKFIAIDKKTKEKFPVDLLSLKQKKFVIKERDKLTGMMLHNWHNFSKRGEYDIFIKIKDDIISKMVYGF